MSSAPRLTRPKIQAEQPWFAILSTLQRAMVGFALATSIFLTGGLLDWFVTRRYLPKVSLMLAGAGIALAGGVLVFQILTDIQQRYRAMQERLEKIVELNHHIRNALQVIAYNNTLERSERGIQQVNGEILRIESVLREVSGALGDEADFSTAVIGPILRRRR